MINITHEIRFFFRFFGKFPKKLLALIIDLCYVNKRPKLFFIYVFLENSSRFKTNSNSQFVNAMIDFWKNLVSGWLIIPIFVPMIYNYNITVSSIEIDVNPSLFSTWESSCTFP